MYYKWGKKIDGQTDLERIEASREEEAGGGAWQCTSTYVMIILKRRVIITFHALVYMIGQESKETN